MKLRKLKRSKKGMNIGDLYQFVLLLVLIGLVLGVGLITLGHFGETDGINNTVKSNINGTIQELGAISTTWLGLIVTIAVLSIIITLVIRSFAGRGR